MRKSSRPSWRARASVLIKSLGSFTRCLYNSPVGSIQAGALLLQPGTAKVDPRPQHEKDGEGYQDNDPGPVAEMAEGGTAQHIDDGEDDGKIGQREKRRPEQEADEGQFEPADGDIAGEHQAWHDAADEAPPEQLAAEPIPELLDPGPDEISPRQGVVAGEGAEPVKQRIAGH